MKLKEIWQPRFSPPGDVRASIDLTFMNLHGLLGVFDFPVVSVL